MKFSCLQENLKKALITVTPVAGKNTTLPILNNVLIKAKEGGVVLTTTNLEIAVEYNLRGKVEKEGEITTQAKLLLDYIQLLPKEMVNLILNDQVVDIKCQNWQTKIKGITHEDFPLIPAVAVTDAVQLAVGDFREALNQVLFAAATDELRPEISGVYCQFKKAQLVMAATDSYRLAEKTVDYKKGPVSDRGVIIPGKTLTEVARMLTDAQANNIITMELAENQILFSFDETRVTSRLIEGQYPDYQQIIPQTFITQIKLPAEELKKAVKSASLFSKTGINDTHWHFSPTDNQTIISAANSLVGEQRAVVKSEIAGEESDIALNYRYVLDGLNAIKTPELELKVSGSNSPAVFRPVGAKDKSETLVYLVMPIRQ